jgi:hypothetical protein
MPQFRSGVHGRLRDIQRLPLPPMNGVRLEQGLLENLEPLTSNLFLRCSDLVVIFLSFIGIITIIIDGSNPVKGHADGTEIEA